MSLTDDALVGGLVEAYAELYERVRVLEQRDAVLRSALAGYLVSVGERYQG